MNNTTKKFHPSAKQVAALEYLARNPNIESCAATIGNSKSTVYSWLAKEGFRIRLSECRTEILDEAVDQIKCHTRQAIQKIAELMQSDNDTIALKASTYMLDKALEVKAIQEFETRIVQLEMTITKKETLR
jgi:hypothetical protein